MSIHPEVEDRIMGAPTPPDTGTATDTVTSADGTEIAVERTGSGPPLVLVHGGATDRGFWERADVRSALAEQCAVYAMDCRGVGESGDASVYALEREFKDVTAVVDSIDEPVTLLGHSSGSLFSLEAARRTDNLCGLLLYEPPIPLGDHALYPEAIVDEMERLLDDDEDEQVLVLFLEAIADLPPEAIAATRADPNWEHDVEVARTLPRQLRAVGEYTFDASRVADVSTPTLLLSGSESIPLVRDATDAVADALPDSRVVVFDGHEHEAMFTATSRFLEAVLAFVSETN